MLCIPDSEELPGIVEKAGGIGCMLQDAVFLATTVAQPALQKQIQARNQCCAFSINRRTDRLRAMSSFRVSLIMQLLKDTAPTQAHQIPRLGSISALLPTAPAATHGRSLVVHRSNKWVKSLVAALEQLPASSGRTSCGLCRYSATLHPLPRCLSSHVFHTAGTAALRFSATR